MISVTAGVNNTFFVVVDNRRSKYNLDVIDARPGLMHSLNRETIYEDVLKLYSKTSIIQEIPSKSALLVKWLLMLVE